MKSTKHILKKQFVVDWNNIESGIFEDANQGQTVNDLYDESMLFI